VDSKDARDKDGKMILSQAEIDKISDSVMRRLTEEAQSIETTNEDLLALDWMNGRRTPDMNMHLKGALKGLTLGTDAPHIFKALVESTAFGAKAIVERIVEEGVRIDGVITLGGVAKKSEFVMQILADVLNMPIKVVKSEETCALGAAMFASVVAGVYPNVNVAQDILGKGFEETYHPQVELVEKYSLKYDEYRTFGCFLENNMANPK
jgi:L-ribulokinase